MPNFAILIPTYNNSDLTIKCAKSIKKNSKDGSYCIYWVDDGSKEEEFKKVKDFLEKEKIKFVEIRKKQNSGFIKSVNLGFKKILEDKIEFSVLLNNDTIIYTKNWLSDLKDVLDTDKKIGIVSPLTSSGDASPWKLTKIQKDFPKEIYTFFKDRDLSETAKFLKENYNDFYVKTLNRLAFCCVMLRREVIEEIGFLDEIYGFGYYDDDDYCERIYRSGYFGAICCYVLIEHGAEKTFSKKYKDLNWQKKKKEIYTKNLNIFQKKFGYGKYEDAWEIGSDQEMLVRLWRKEKEKNELIFKIEKMQNSVFWKFRNKYLRVKAFLWGK